MGVDCLSCDSLAAPLKSSATTVEVKASLGIHSRDRANLRSENCSIGFTKWGRSRKKSHAEGASGVPALARAKERLARESDETVSLDGTLGD